MRVSSYPCRLILLSIVALIAYAPAARAAYTVVADVPPGRTVWLESLDLGKMTCGWGTPQSAKSVTKNPLKLGGKVYEHGVGTHAYSEFLVDLQNKATKFTATVGVDDSAGKSGSVKFQVWVDQEKKADTGVLRAGDQPQAISVDLNGAKYLYLVVTDGDDGIDGDHADWADASIQMFPAIEEDPMAVQPTIGSAPPIARSSSPKPAIHGPRIVGATPGRPFLFGIPATGTGPLTFSATNLPAGLTLDSKTGIITGALEKAGRTTVQLMVRGAQGVAKRKLVIVGGDKQLALTPPMGWNSWYVWFSAVDDAKMRAAADALVSTGLAAHGYQYVNIDDGWEGSRDANGGIQTNSKFPDMKALADYIHAKGLKFGLYSSPGPKTCAGFEGSYQHEEQDAKIYAKWGADFLKYDWCSYAAGTKASIETLQKPYQDMHDALDKCGRDMVYSFCQYGMGSVWEWGEKTGGNMWRVGNDINDSWSSISNVIFSQNGREKYAGPGHWNDLDMLLVGKVGFGGPHDTKLTPNEQIAHFTAWAMLASPLLLDCDLTKMDQFTIDLVTNDDVIDVDQDPLGQPAKRIAGSDGTQLWARPLWDGTQAVAVFNRGIMEIQVTIDWSDIGLKGSQPVRDLWQRQDLGPYKDSFTVAVAGHGVTLVKVGTPVGN